MKVYLPYFGGELCFAVFNSEEKAWQWLKDEYVVVDKTTADKYSAGVEEVEVQ